MAAHLKPRQSEWSLQVSVVRMLAIVLDPEKTWWSALDAGAGKISKRAAGMMKARGVKRGLPDLIIMSYGVQPPLVGIELKADSGKQTPDQLLVAHAWEKMGFPIYVARSLEHIQQILDYCNVPMRSRMRLFPRGAYHDEPAVGPEAARHQRPRRRRQSKNPLPLVFADQAQEE